jgi:hypothetical protein
MNQALMGLLALFFGHAIADFGLQNDFVARGKNPTIVTFRDSLGEHAWVWIMLAHCLIHSGFVLFITHSVTLTVAEIVLHFIIDYNKCVGRYGFSTDQLFHYTCKVCYWLLLVILPHFGQGRWLK